LNTGELILAMDPMECSPSEGSRRARIVRNEWTMRAIRVRCPDKAILTEKGYWFRISSPSIKNVPEGIGRFGLERQNTRLRKMIRCNNKIDPNPCDISSRLITGICAEKAIASEAFSQLRDKEGVRKLKEMFSSGSPNVNKEDSCKGLGDWLLAGLE